MSAQSTHSIKEDSDNASSKDQPRFYQRCLSTAYAILTRYFFLFGLGVVIGLAWAFPSVGKSNGDIKAQYTVKWGAVIVIFLLSGLGLEVSVMLRTMLRWRLHLVVQVISFIVLPFVMYGVVRFFVCVHADLDPTVYKGWIIALSTSTTVSSNAVMTRNANGNDGAAVLNAALGNILGIFISPALMTAFQNDPIVFEPGTDRGNPDYLSILKNLGCTVLAPLVVGQVLRYWFPARVKYLAAKCKFPIINTLALLALVWSVFSDSRASDAFSNTGGVDIVAIIFVDIAMYLFGCSICLFVARLPWPTRYRKEPIWVTRWRFSRKDAVAIMYCGATKTVSMGIPLINVLYAQSSYGIMGVLSLPLLMYHIFQLVIGNLQVPLLKKWIEEENEITQTTEQVLPRNSSDCTPSSTMRRRE
ncbi:putative sodium bile acid cotransporter [Gilbertella persicaria]|uniref:putative sodium bile acid cotransporter n=1 Tax=Gilbertella persicaria TaxID=101096 RepID=UPI00221F53FF|nr:putative sodium bile acid cotransporter [Gilbertella persicaria]KAI8065371.1 putative sodium bile acid cotransporter [Gilbertella persicaria]